MNYIWWSDPLFDRTQSDIDFLTYKSRLNASDLNRIEGNLGWLSDKWQVPMSTIKWIVGSLDLTLPQINRIVNNARSIKQALVLQSEPFDTVLYWPDLNTIEKIIFDAYQIYILLLDWDCLECKVESWDDFDELDLSWNEWGEIGCEYGYTWDLFESTFLNWDDFEFHEFTWDQLDCFKGG